MASEEFVIALTTFPLDADAEAFARTLVEERLAACVNVLPPMQSIYTWADRVESSEERQLIMKTTKERLTDLHARVKTLHPYAVPEFLVLPVLTGDDDYLSWLRDGTRRPV